MIRAILCFGGPDRAIVDENGKCWNFEMHPYCGPAVIKKNGDVSGNQPPENSSFWRVVSWWAQQGGKIGDDGFCVWTKPQPPSAVKTAAKLHFRIKQ